MANFWEIHYGNIRSPSVMSVHTVISSSQICTHISTKNRQLEWNQIKKWAHVISHIREWLLPCVFKVMFSTHRSCFCNWDTGWQICPTLFMPAGHPGPALASLLTLHLTSSVSSKLMRTSRPPTSQMASWHVSCIKLKSIMAHRVSTVAVWSPPCNKNAKHERMKKTKRGWRGEF